MLGMEDGIITFAWVATILSAVGCVIFGIVFWNYEGDEKE
ncbi:symporter small accessory protein [Virgibacillus sp. FSP13]